MPTPGPTAGRQVSGGCSAHAVAGATHRATSQEGPFVGSASRGCGAGEAYHSGPDGDWGHQDELNPWPDVEWDPFVGCQPVSPGCLHCYGARRIAARVQDHPSISREHGIPTFTGEVFFAPNLVTLPLTAQAASVIFFCAHCDAFQPKIEYAKLSVCFDVMRETPWHRYNVLTKYPERAAAFFERWGKPPANVRMGISVESRKLMDERWLHLRLIEASTYILSLEPLLEPIAVPHDFRSGWVVAMREVGKSPRPAKAEWFSSLREQCRALGVPFFWETTSQDGRELVEERLEALRRGDPYLTMGLNWGLPQIGRGETPSPATKVDDRSWIRRQFGRAARLLRGGGDNP